MDTTINNTPTSDNKFENTIIWQIATNLTNLNAPIVFTDKPKTPVERFDELPFFWKICKTQIENEEAKIKIAQDGIRSLVNNHILQLDLSSFELGEDENGNTTIKGTFYRVKVR